ncbi:MAG TPA: hypothetical protein ENJ30_08480 [Desulfobulbaceae bacterium]|nr:hypothetical protein [Desulfobulbaceae bacterium]
MLRIISYFFLIYLSCSPTLGHAQGKEDTDPALSRSVNSALEKGRAEAKKITLPVNKHAEEGLKAAEETAKVFHSVEFQSKVQRETQRLKKEVGECTASSSSWKKEGEKQGAEEPVSSLSDAEKVYLFLSSSIPDETIHNYLVDVARVEDPNLIPVMRGMVNGVSDKKANTKYFSKILKEDMGCHDDFRNQKICARFKTDILFQPPLFTRYGIERVPALIYDNGGRVFLIQGDAGLDYLLERVNRDAKQKSLESLIAKIQERSK